MHRFHYRLHISSVVIRFQCDLKSGVVITITSWDYKTESFTILTQICIFAIKRFSTLNKNNHENFIALLKNLGKVGQHNSR